jgi:hypothetical protein
MRSGVIALASTKIPWKPSPKTCSATSSAIAGGQMLRIRSLERTTSSTEPTSSKAAARCLVASLLPSLAQTTSARAALPTAAPI